MIEFINFYLFPALAIGSVYALGAVGISMIFGILRFAHFAHGDLMTVGTYGVLAAAGIIAINPLLLAPLAKIISGTAVATPPNISSQVSRALPARKWLSPVTVSQAR